MMSTLGERASTPRSTPASDSGTTFFSVALGSPAQEDEDMASRTTNIWCARIIPVIILAITGFGVYVVVDLVAVEYLIRGSSEVPSKSPRRPEIAIPYLIFFFILLLLWLSCYLRTVLSMIFDPGLIEKGEEAVPEMTSNRSAVRDGLVLAPPGIGRFCSKSVYVCDNGGLPKFCEDCNNFKPDRAHHSSEIERCVARMDHFCPWVGGMVSESNMKYFVQFTFWATLWSLYMGSFLIWVLVDRRRREGNVDAQWCAALGLVALFGGLLAGGMFFTTIWNAAFNRTTLETTYPSSILIAVLAPRRLPLSEANPRNLPIITYPLHLNANKPSKDIGQEEDRLNDSEPRTYIILQTLPKDNIWNVSRLENLKSVLGARYVDWILPLGRPPITRHDSYISDYPLGPDFERLCKDAGIQCPYNSASLEKNSSAVRHS